MVQAALHPSSGLAEWRERAGSVSPVLGEALDTCAVLPMNQAECVDVLELLLRPRREPAGFAEEGHRLW